MAKDDKAKTISSRAIEKYRRVDISSLDRGRRGKHHDLIQGILSELATAEPGLSPGDSFGRRWRNWAREP